MPTAAKLVSGILMAALGWWVADLISGYLPAETRTGRFREISALLGLAVGWRFLGRRAVEGFSAAIAFGVGASAVLVFWMMLVFSGIEMTKRSLRKAYDSPMEAIQGMIDIAIGYFQFLTPMDVALTLILGGIGAAVLAFLVSRRWS